MNATVAPPTTCPRCGAALRPERAEWLSGLPGYGPVLTWRHARPDGRGRCVVKSGPPVGSSPPQALPSGRGAKIPA